MRVFRERNVSSEALCWSFCLQHKYDTTGFHSSSLLSLSSGLSAALLVYGKVRS